MRTTIVVGIDGSEPSQRAVEWCATYAPALDAEIVAVHAVDFPAYAAIGPYPVPELTDEQRGDLRDVAALEWCKPLADAGVRHRILLVDGSPVHAISETAKAEDAVMVVTGRRGRGGFAELVLGSTSHQLTHHLDRPHLIVP